MSVLTSVPTYNHIHVKVILQSLWFCSLFLPYGSPWYWTQVPTPASKRLSTESFHQPIISDKSVEHYYYLPPLVQFTLGNTDSKIQVISHMCTRTHTHTHTLATTGILLLQKQFWHPTRPCLTDGWTCMWTHAGMHVNTRASESPSHSQA